MYAAHPLPSRVLAHDHMWVSVMQDLDVKLQWIQSAVLAVNPKDLLLAPHMRPILQQLKDNLQKMFDSSPPSAVASQCRICLHMVNSQIHSCP